MPSLLNVSNASNESEEFSLKDIEMVADNKQQNWFQRAHVGKILELVHIYRSTARLADKDQKIWAFLKVERGCHDATPPREDAQDHDIFILLSGARYVVVNSQKIKGKAFKKHILNDIVPRGFDVRTEEIQEKDRQAIEEKDATIALLNDDLKNRELENVGLQGEIRAKDQQIAALQRRYVGYLSDEDKNNGISIIAKKNDEAECLYISICGQHGYRRHKVRVLLTCNKGSTLFANGDTPIRETIC